MKKNAALQKESSANTQIHFTTTPASKELQRARDTFVAVVGGLPLREPVKTALIAAASSWAKAAIRVGEVRRDG